MKITNKEEFEKQNVFGTRNANTAYAQYFYRRILFKSADKAGYRLIDTAQAYGNERGVGEGITHRWRAKRGTFGSIKSSCRAQNL